MNGSPLPPKKEVALALLERGSVHVHLDPRAAGVVVPAWFKRQPQLVLQVGLNMPVPIPDLRVDDEGMSCTLSFNRSPFFCVVPLSAVYAMVGDDGRGMVWPEDVPPEVALQSRSREAEPAAKKPVKRALTAVESPGSAASMRAATRRTTPKPRAVRGEAAPEAKKPRAAKKPAHVVGTTADEPPSVQGARGVLVPIPSAAKRQPLRSADAPPPPAPAPNRAPAAPRHAPRHAPSHAPGHAPSHAPSHAPGHAPGHGHTPAPSATPAGTKPQHQAPRKQPGKTKREIPPYLRVVK